MIASVILVFIILFILYKYFIPDEETRAILKKIPGPKPIPFLGNAHQLKEGHELYLQTSGFADEFSNAGIVAIWLAFEVRLGIFQAEHVEAILSGVKHIDKSSDYNFLHPWLGTGLLTSTGEKWKNRRRLLTPSFHFNILHDFLPVFNRKSHIFIDKMLDKATRGVEFNIFQDIALCALDIIAETAMGTDVNAQSSDSEYVHAVYSASELTNLRVRKPWLWPSFLFNLVGPGHEYNKNLKTLHDFTTKVIMDRLKDFDSIQAELVRQEMEGEGGVDCKVKLAFLDMLIYMSDDLTKLSIDELREEVDTFMFEGHDTTAAAMNWAVHLIGANPAVQTKVQEEIASVFGEDARDPTMDDVRQLKYLECCIKEALRLFPSVPMFGRRTSEDVQLGEYTIPKNTTVVVLTTALHRDPTQFPEPEEFRPERFMLSEKTRNRHPYSYIPFSAGPRNCIGQKFALLELKTVLCHFFRTFHVKSCQTREELRPVGDLILRPENGIIVKLTRRER